MDAAPDREARGATLAPRDLSSLPYDILALIFADISIGRRLRRLSLVCKRWRAIALRSIATLTISPPSATAPPLSLSIFPALTSLTLHLENTHRWDPIILPSALTGLHIHCNDGNQAQVAPITATPVIVNTPACLKRIGFSFDTLQCLLPSVLASVSSITALDIAPSTAVPLDHIHTLVNTRFPSLTDLSLRWPSGRAIDSLYKFVAAHAPQLVTLTFCSTSAYTQELKLLVGGSVGHRGPIFPRLTAFILGSMSVTTRLLLDFLPHCPLITRMEIPLRSWMCDRTDKVTGISIATRIRIFERLSAILFPQFPLLQDLSVDFNDANMVPDAFASLVTQASLAHGKEELILKDLAKCTNITDLHIEAKFQIPLTSRGISLPKLRSLAIDSSNLPTLRALLHNNRCQEVETLTIHCNSVWLDERHVPVLLDILSPAPSISLVTIRIPDNHLKSDFISALRAAERSSCVHFAVAPHV